MVSGSVLSSSPRGPAEVVLLGFIEDTVDTIHASTSLTWVLSRPKFTTASENSKSRQWPAKTTACAQVDY
jgi:hypothetical protein